MMDSNPTPANKSQCDPEKDALDHKLDATLAKFTTADPRAGLEDRILATLRTEQERAAEPSWWRWPAIAALVAMIVVTVFVGWRSRKPVQNIAAQHPQITMQTIERVKTPVATNSERSSIPLHEPSERRLRPRTLSRPAAIAVPSPKPDQFPSPQPLSQQEIILADYIKTYPEHAALIAEARTDELRQDSAEEMDDALSGSNQNSQRNK
jgi:hypothetical protein